MRRVLFGVLWLLAFCAAGVVAGVHTPLHAPLPARLHMPLIGLAAGLSVFGLAVWRNWLPGLAKAQPLRWGVWQAVWLLLGFLGMQLVGAVGFTILDELITHQPVSSAPASAAGLVAATLAGYAAATLWSLWYINRQGRAKQRDGSPTGFGWRSATSEAYKTAALLAGAIIVLVMVLVDVFPPNLSALKDNETAKLFATPGIAALCLLILAVFIAPPVEEYVFRGGIFAALASRLSPLWAGLITSALFVAVHAPEKIYYPRGFIDVGLMALAAAWLRVRFNSIRPAILLHVLYNGGLMLAAGLSGGGAS
ncbi:MAG: hypothetical protein B7Z71_09525 [Acidocella sp. 21-58-7]|nr:MAG: hypothetical protein B7Z71_09525 [Acidocella sp. 21-58-7]